MEIRIAEITDKQKIVNFIDEHWQKNHILVRWPDLFDDYYSDEGKVNFAIAIENDIIYGLCGFIYSNPEEIWIALWKAIPNSNYPMLGLIILQKVSELLKPKTISCCGIRKDVIRLYEFLGYQTGKLKHFYRLNSALSPCIAKVIKEERPSPLSNIGCGNISMISLDTEEDFIEKVNLNDEVFSQYVPRKTRNYVIRKYFNNIAYQYKVFGLSDDASNIKAVFVVRICEAAGGRCMRIVDYLGDESLLQQSGSRIDSLLQEFQCEYVDIYEYGLEDQSLSDIGMKEVNEEEIIIPNFFEPFEQVNADIYFSTTNIDNFRMFKADGDQERPNIKPEGLHEL